ncbi:cofilin family protein [Streptomyces sp. NPDC055085]
MNDKIAVDENCLSAFLELKANRTVNTLFYRLSNNLDTCVVESQDNLTHDELLRALPADEPRLVVYDLAFATANGARKNKIVLIAWLPGLASSRHTAAYGQAHTVLGALLDGSQMSVQAADPTDLKYQRLVSQAG